MVAIAPDGTQTAISALPSIAFGQEIAGAGRLALLDGTLYMTHGDWIAFLGMERRPFMAVVARVDGGEPVEVADLWAFEVASNPDPYLVHSHPYDIEVGPDGILRVADAGANALLKVDPASGAVELVTVFDGVPSPMPNPNRGGALESDPVPTGVAFDAAGNAYVTLNGIGAPGSGQVVRYYGLTAMSGSPLPAPVSAATTDPAPVSGTASEPTTLPTTGAPALNPACLIGAAGLVLLMAGFAISARRRQTESVRIEQQ